MPEQSIIADFSGGVNKQAHDLTLPPSQYRTGKNLKIEGASLRKVGGISNLFATRNHQITNFERYINSSGQSLIVFAQNGDGIYYYNEDLATITNITTSFSTFTSSARMGSALYLADPSRDLMAWEG